MTKWNDKNHLTESDERRRLLVNSDRNDRRKAADRPAATGAPEAPKTNLSALVDAYGALMAQRANIEGEKKRMEKALADVPEGAYEGELFRLTISDSILKKPDEDYKAEIDAVVEAFKATKSLQYVTAHTIKTPSRRHLAKARNGDVE